jgi:hypothetical protein
MPKILFTLVCVFFLSGKKDPTILNPKLPVIVTVLKCTLQSEVEKKIIAALQEKHLELISSEKGAEIFREELRKVRERQSESDLRNLKPSQDGMMDFMQGQLNKIPVYAQRLYIKLVQGSNQGIDSCYYYIRQQPEPVSRYFGKMDTDTRVFMPDSIIKKNDMGILVSALVKRSLANPY